MQKGVSREIAYKKRIEIEMSPFKLRVEENAGYLWSSKIENSYRSKILASSAKQVLGGEIPIMFN